MTMEPTIEDTARALSDLNMFYAIIALCEGSLISADHYPACERIIKICRTESAKALHRYDTGRLAIMKRESR